MGGFKGNLIFSQPCAFLLDGVAGKAVLRWALNQFGRGWPRRAAIFVSGTTHTSLNIYYLFEFWLIHKK